MPKVISSAISVLEGVKRRGAAAGEYMDPDTETVLRPQIMQEAFAREVIKLLQEISK
jgi:hypothetical protein